MTDPKIPMPGSQVEVTRVDPQMFATPVVAPQMPDLEPINLDIAAKQAAFVPPPPAPPPKIQPAQDPMTVMVSKKLVHRLAQRLGMRQPDAAQKATLPVGDGLEVEFRYPTQDDHLWALAVIEHRMEANEDRSLLETGIQRKLYAKSLAYCRCVEGMLGEKIWDLLDLAQEIDYAVTSNKGTDWDGRFETIPDMLRAHMGREVYRALNDLDPDALTSLMQAVDEALSKRSIAPEEPDPFLTP